MHTLKQSERGYPVCAAATVTSKHTTDGSAGRRRRKEGELRLQRGTGETKEGKSGINEDFSKPCLHPGRRGFSSSLGHHHQPNPAFADLRAGVSGLGSTTSPTCSAPSISGSQDDPKDVLCSSRREITLFRVPAFYTQQNKEATLVHKTFHKCRSRK